MLYTELRWLFFFQAEDGIRDLVRSRGLGDVYKRQDTNIMKFQILQKKILLAGIIQIIGKVKNILELGLSLIHI